MPIPDLTLATGRRNVSQGTGVPVNGLNTFRHNWNLQPFQINADFIKLEYAVQGPSITAVSFAGLTPDLQSIQLNVTQTGGDAMQVTAEHEYSAET